MPKKSRRVHPSDRFFVATRLNEKQLSKLPLEVAPLHVIANRCLKEAAGSDSWAAEGPTYRSADPHRASSHDPDLKRAEETVASTHDALRGTAEEWRELARRADQLAQDILNTKRADLDKIRLTEEAKHDAFHLYESHSARIHPPKGSSEAK